MSEKKEIEIYLYPKCKLTKKENLLAKRVMVIGPTGAGKTTLLNSFINSHLGVEFSDKFRYMLIVEETGRSQA